MCAGMVDRIKVNFMRYDIVIQNPFLSGSCEECVNHCKQTDGNRVKHICCANIIGVRTRDCRKIPRCDKYNRNYKADGADWGDDAMRLDNLKVQIALVIPFGRPDKNGVMYSKEAIEKAVDDFHGKLPILYRDNDLCKDGVVIGNTVGETCSMLWDDKYQVCEVIVNGNLYYGGAECLVNETRDGVVTDFNITSIGLSR